MRGRWAAGIVPRNFTWIITERLAVSERPGGHAPNHRKVRRQEEIIWLKAAGFNRVVSLISSEHNLHAYEEGGLPAAHFAMSAREDPKESLVGLYPLLLSWLRAGDRILIHQEELGERVAGVVAGFLFWSGLIPDQPRAISVTEQLVKREMGSIGRAVVAACVALPPPSEPIVIDFKEASRSDKPDSDDSNRSSAAVGLAPLVAMRRADVDVSSSQKLDSSSRQSGREPGPHQDNETPVDEVRAKKARPRATDRAAVTSKENEAEAAPARETKPRRTSPKKSQE